MSEKWTPSITVRAIQPVIAALETLGYPVDDILAAADVTRTVLADADGRIPHPAMMILWQQALKVTGDNDLGIHLAEAAPIESFEIHGYALLSSPVLREAYRRGSRYQRLIHEATDLTFEEGDQEGILQHALPGGRPVPRHPAEFLVTLWIRLGRLIAGKAWVPNLVCFAHESPTSTSEHTRIFQSPIQFSSGRTAMHVPNAILDLENAKADTNLVAILDRYASTLLEQAPASETVGGRVRAQLLDALQSGIPAAEEVAQSLHMSARSLHRALQQEETTFRALSNQLRQEQAARYLTNTNIGIAEVGFLLGFSELSSFYRAFKRWTGVTPAEYRANALQ